MLSKRVSSSSIITSLNQNTPVNPCLQKKWKKFSQNEKTKYTILPYTRQFSNDFFTKTKIRCFYLKIQHYIDNKFYQLNQKKPQIFFGTHFSGIWRFFCLIIRRDFSEKRNVIWKANSFFIVITVDIILSPPPLFSHFFVYHFWE